MYFISSWRWLAAHSRAITSCCLSEPIRCTTPYTLGPWCCSEVSGTPLVISPRCWGRQDRTGQVSVATLHRGWLLLSLCLCICVLTYVHTCTLSSASHVCVFVCGCTCLHMYTCSGISSTTAAEHWKQEAGNKWLKKCRVYWGCHVSATQYMSCCCCRVCLLYLQQPGNRWKQMHTSREEVQHFKQCNN